MKITAAKERKAISPIIATVLVIAATLIAFAAVAGYMFGIFGSTASKANVSVSTQTALTPTDITGGFNVYFLNSGTSNGQVASGSIAYGGVSCTLAVSGTNPAIVPGSATTVAFTAVSASSCTGGVLPTASAGQTYSFSFALADGSPVQYTGTFS